MTFSSLLSFVRYRLLIRVLGPKTQSIDTIAEESVVSVVRQTKTVIDLRLIITLLPILHFIVQYYATLDYIWRHYNHSQHRHNKYNNRDDSICLLHEVSVPHMHGIIHYTAFA